MRNFIFITTFLVAWISLPCFASTYVKSAFSLPLSLDPIKMNDQASLVVGNLIYDGLLKFSPSLEIQESLAESWSTSSDGKTLTFKLKPNIKFHDGTPITADDVVYSLARAVSPESTVRKYYDCIQGADEKSGKQDTTKVGIKAIDSNTVEIKLKKPFPAFISILAGATAKILPKKYKDSKNFFDSPIGSGPFRFVYKDAVNKKLFLEAFDSYYQGKSKLDKFVLLESSEDTASELAKKNEVLDLACWPLTPNNPVFQKGKKITSPVAATWIIGLNSKIAPFNSIEVRKAFKESFDTEGFRKKFYPDAYQAFGYIPPGLSGYNDGPKSASVKSLKLKVTRQKITIVIPQELSEAKEMKRFFERNLKEKGWNVEVVPMAWDKLMDGYAKKKHQAFLVSMNMDYPDAEFLLRNFESNNPDNFSGLNNKKLDALISTSRAETDKIKRVSLYKEAIKLLDDSSVTINLFHPRANYWISNCVEGLVPNILSDVYIDYTKVSINEECMKNGGKL
ncbi:MAG: ABC transporter substrate-binding protein [Bacteriovorax sp.]|nr:ABC transporter substrate-binding protein [Bacteriovorax sp.]